MTRFMMTLSDAVDLVFLPSNMERMVICSYRKTAATISILAEALCKLLNKPDYPIDIIGTRHGESSMKSCAAERKWRVLKILKLL